MCLLAFIIIAKTTEGKRAMQIWERGTIGGELWHRVNERLKIESHTYAGDEYGFLFGLRHCLANALSANVLYDMCLCVCVCAGSVRCKITQDTVFRSMRQSALMPLPRSIGSPHLTK